ncbi:mono/diheme cytochrome c family protein [Bradyrhizobium elkanii]|uniref:Cytochrome c n=1 Tax=Bradyrhizobium brasilense TaxID=1419277 RepID=A0ABY8JM69_9BRAD|nr:cytochrome c [Bradyrhizobium brasilense]MCP1913817.1 mono/diheme cytochrome c family protein [Bradyrhizobium elkanii]WFU66188.1 cytochrome c [Bradyrhizobium brasilense]
MKTLVVTFIMSVAFLSPRAESANAQDQQALRARGEYLVNGPAACGNCHTQRAADLFADQSKYLAGGNRIEDVPGLAFSKNITPDNDTGIGSWTDTQIIRAIREGVTREGNLLGPPMPIDYYNKMSDDDVKAIVAYLRTVKPIRNEVMESSYKIQLHAEPPAKGLPAPPKTDKVAYGAYLAGLAHCLGCHTPPGANGAPDYDHLKGAGGRSFHPIAGKLVRGANITSDKETGIGSWTDAEVKRAITKGIDRDGRQLVPPMPYPYFKNMTPEDLDALVAYIRTLPAISNKVEPNVSLEAYLK